MVNTKNNNYELVNYAYTNLLPKCNNMLPPFYIIEPTNKCNFKCSICPNRYYSDNEKGIMSWELFTKIINEIKHVAVVIQLYWMGESFLHDQIFEMIDFCKSFTTAKVMLSTNGSFLDPDNIEKLVSSRLDDLIISMDACDSQSIYAKIRSGGNIADLNRNVYNLLLKNKSMNIVLQFIDLNLNRVEKIKFIEKWKKMKCKINIQCLYSWANQFPELNRMSDNLSPMISTTRAACSDLWYKASIHFNGNVSICCFDWNNTQYIGNLAEDTMLNIWSNDSIAYCRTIHKCLDFSKIKICSNCDSWATYSEYKDLFNFDKNQ
jgi:organic radical activating enzyme